MNILTKTLVLCLLPLSAAAADGVSYFGFAPLEIEDAQKSFQGSGKNKYIEAAICLDPQVTPYLANLKGSQIVGVRCYVRTDYKQKMKGYSCVNLYEGSLNAEPVRKTVNFTAGWNEVMFDEPYTLGAEPVYVGFRVFELQGVQSHPLVSYSKASVTGGFYVSIDRAPWEEVTSKGTLLIQAILADPDGKLLDAPGALAHPSEAPLIVAPDEAFEGSWYVHNFSTRPIKELIVETTDPARSYSLTLPEPIGTGESTQIPAEIFTGSTEGTDVKLTAAVTSINGVETAPAHHSSARLFVSADNFIRLPLIEEFTSLDCVNCPFMAYFLEKGREAFGKPHVFVAHHSGFKYDIFTQQVDKDIEYLFFGNKGNPYACYDRTILPGQTSIMVGAKTADVEPYTELITQANDIPALASVKVQTTLEGSELSVSVSGRMSTGDKTADGKVYISTYLIEDNIGREDTDLWQSGVDFDLDPDSPKDLVETYRHNGVIRVNLCTEPIGDLVNADAEGNYSVSYPAVKVDDAWARENCHVVSFLHRINKNDPRDNYVLNAGDSKPLGGSAAIEEVEQQEGRDALRFNVTADRRIAVTTAARAVRVFTLSGASVDAGSPLTPGIYLLQVTLPSGAKASRKVAVF